ncbi:MAG: enoyl-CoA hydratase/isomerase family protein [Chloroflexota bacterium]
MVTAIQVRDDQDGVRWITFWRPKKLNALLPEDLDAITHALSEQTPTPRAAVLTGSGERAFSAGMHLDAFHGLNPATARRLIEQVRDCVGSVRKAPFPTVAAINGHCLGVAFEMALACDLRVAADHATVGLPEIKVGIPSVVDAALLQQHVGLSKAKEMILTGDLYPVAELAPLGLFNAVVSPEQLLEATHKMLARVTPWTPTVVAAQKRLFEIWQNTTLQDGIEASVVEFSQVFTSSETATQIAERRASVGRRQQAEHEEGVERER